MPKQQALMFCQDRKLRRVKISIVGNLLIDTQKVRAYLCFHRFYQKIDGLGDKLWLWLLERRALPVSPYTPNFYKDKELEDMTNEDTLAEEALQFTFATTPKSEAKSKLYDYTAIGILGMITTIVIITLAVATKSCTPTSFGF